MTRRDYLNAALFIIGMCVVIGFGSYGIFCAANSYHIGKIKDEVKSQHFEEQLYDLQCDLVFVDGRLNQNDSINAEQQRMINILDTLGGKLINFANNQVKWNNDNSKR